MKMYCQMKKFLVYPEGYDPTIANGPPSKFQLSIGCNWSKEDTEKMKKLGEEAKIKFLDQAPQGRWVVEII
jgi:hypothetical protein